MRYCPRRPDALLLTLCLGCLLLASCGREKRDPIAETFPYYSDPGLAGIQRLLLLPAFRNDGVGRSAVAVDNAMANAWRELGRFEVIEGTTAVRDRQLPVDVLRLGTIPSEALREMRVAHGADAALITRIEHLDPYDPVSLGLQAVVIDCGDGTVLWSAGGHFDSQRRDVQRDIRSWYRATVGEADEHISGWRLTLQSPRLFARYVCDRLAATADGRPAVAESGLFSR